MCWVVGVPLNQLKYITNYIRVIIIVVDASRNQVFVTRDNADIWYPFRLIAVNVEKRVNSVYFADVSDVD